MNEEHDYEYTMHMTIEDVRLMHYCVQKAIEYWPGAPARPYEEQEQMWFQPGCFLFLSFQGGDLMGRTPDTKDRKAIPYMRGPSRLFCRPFLFLSWWPPRWQQMRFVLICLFLWKYHACITATHIILGRVHPQAITLL